MPSHMLGQWGLCGPGGVLAARDGQPASTLGVCCCPCPRKQDGDQNSSLPTCFTS
ncbi:hypothetical protein I79_014855 [Cricetulus griseus]|uniref:Uncharacterized protein n=1 Tax=Cricetulus griseus TaxID=10029 RepID=G3HV78_CRIGR|nr:hypothetical protein I79_014855 [Cricetulus griseus]